MALGHLVVVIPGIGGSVLETLDGKPVWGHGRRGIAGPLARPEQIAADRRLVAVDAIRTVTAVPCLPWAVNGYEGLLSGIERQFPAARVDVARAGVDPDLSADVVVFPYDFRSSVVTAAEQLRDVVQARLSGMTAGARRQRVVVLAHSMGGLVARYWLGPLGGAPDCLSLITIGTPHRGAPKALDVLLNGLAVGPLRLGALSEVMRGWPSVFELLPRYRAVQDDDGKQWYPHQIPSAPEWFAAGAKRAYGMHLDIERAWADLEAPARPDVVPLFARGHATPALSLLGAEGRVKVTKADAPWLSNPGWAGDGTVPAVSAIPIELADRPAVWQPVTFRHMPMPSAPTALAKLIDYSGQSTKEVRGGDSPAEPWLGLDVEPVHPAETPISISAQLWLPGGHGGDPDGVTVEADLLTPQGYRVRGSSTTLQYTDGSWTGQLPAPAAGVYRVRVRAVDVPGPDRLGVEDVIHVLADQA